MIIETQPGKIQGLLMGEVGEPFFENPTKSYKKRARRETRIADIFEDIMWAGMEATDAGKMLLVQVQILNHPQWNDFHQNESIFKQQALVKDYLATPHIKRLRIDTRTLVCL